MAKKHLFIGLIAACGLLSTNALLAACNSRIVDNTPNHRYTVNNDGTVSDHQTGLMWAQCGEGQTWEAGSCSGTVSTHTWQGALTQAEAVTLAGYSNWRLPNIKELKSLVSRKCANPAINANIFPETPASHFWSGSPTANDSDRAWFVRFPFGGDGSSYDHLKSYSYAVRVVRDGQ